MKIAWIGVNNISKHMINRLLDSNFYVNIYLQESEFVDLNHDNLKKYNLMSEVVENSEIIITTCDNPNELYNIYVNQKNGIFKFTNEKHICIDMSTTDPQLSKELFNNYKNTHFLDAPFWGDENSVINGTISIIVGGDSNIFEEVLPIFKALAENIAYLGEVGFGQHVKLGNQILVNINTVMVSEVLSYCKDNNVDLNLVCEIISNSSGSNWQMNNNGRKIASNDFSGNYFVSDSLKDLHAIKNNSLSKLYGVWHAMKSYENFSSLLEKNNSLGSQSIYKYYRKDKGGQ